MPIGSLSEQTGVKFETIRHHEQVGLLPPPDRSEGNQRRYAAPRSSGSPSSSTPASAFRRP